jgi:mannose-6-phosphate isomerase
VELLTRHFVEKLWGRHDLPTGFGAPAGQQTGEIWYQGDNLPPALNALLVKYLFTSEKLSVQVHPTDAQARAIGLSGGKSECWFVTHAEEGATLGIGLHAAMTADELRAAALDGSIENALVWHIAEAGQCWFIPAGTIHAIGPGVTLVEVQQANDITYRLYDYGRPRELHLDAAVAVAKAEPYTMALMSRPDGAASWLSRNPYFNLLHFTDAGVGATQEALTHDGLLITLDQEAKVDGTFLPSGCVAWVNAGDGIALPRNAAALLALPPSPSPA